MFGILKQTQREYDSLKRIDVRIKYFLRNLIYLINVSDRMSRKF